MRARTVPRNRVDATERADRFRGTDAPRAPRVAVSDQRRIIRGAARGRPRPTTDRADRRRALPGAGPRGRRDARDRLTRRELDGRGECAIADGPGIAPETARRLACDALTRPRSPSATAAAQRRPSNALDPAAVRRALVARDGRCQFPGCERQRFVDAHHILHWARGGETELDNLVLLCRHHHRLVHEGGVSLVATGRPPLHASRRRPIPPRPAPRARPGPPPGPLFTGSGEPMDLAVRRAVLTRPTYGSGGSRSWCAGVKKLR